MSTPLMNLVLPVPGVTTGPDYATLINNALNLVDSHDHTAGKGSQIPVGGIVINQNLDFKNYSLTNLYSTKFTNQSGTITATNSLSVVAGELYFNDATGAAVKITSTGAVNTSGTGQISGMTGTASASFSSLNEAFSFFSSTGIYGKMFNSEVRIFEHVSSAKYVAFKAPTGLAADYTLTLPSALPASTLPLVMTSAGVLATSQISLAMMASNSVSTSQIVDASITQQKLALSSIDGSLLINNTVTPAKLTARNCVESALVSSAPSGSTVLFDVVGLTVTITTIGRPIVVKLAGYLENYVKIDSTAGTTGVTNGGTVAFVKNGSLQSTCDIAGTSLNDPLSSGSLIIPPSSFEFFDNSLTVGTHTYKIQLAVYGGSCRISLGNVKLIAYEL